MNSPAPSPRLPPLHFLLGLAVVAVWGTNFVVIHAALREFPPLLLATLRFGMAAFPAILFVARPKIGWRNIVARDLKVVVSPAFGKMDVIGMNLLSKLKSWRVEGNTLILVPHHPRPEPEA